MPRGNTCYSGDDCSFTRKGSSPGEGANPQDVAVVGEGRCHTVDGLDKTMHVSMAAFRCRLYGVPIFVLLSHKSFALGVPLRDIRDLGCPYATSSTFTLADIPPDWQSHGGQMPAPL